MIGGWIGGDLFGRGATRDTRVVVLQRTLYSKSSLYGTVSVSSG
jgi:hypothetical protein